MANNRMYLTHVPTGYSAYLGKRMGGAWYCDSTNAEIGSEIRKLFDKLEEIIPMGITDDFIIALEDAEFAPHCTDQWGNAVIKEGILVLNIDEDVE